MSAAIGCNLMNFGKLALIVTKSDGRKITEIKNFKCSMKWFIKKKEKWER